ncbi:MAG: hypothetical protein LAO78_13930 [Acidobacteriia bacterium]|nr:hypothetical protein [Terriglobia bacterium]
MPRMTSLAGDGTVTVGFYLVSNIRMAGYASLIVHRRLVCGRRLAALGSVTRMRENDGYE